jgi:hypothetical protein
MVVQSWCRVEPPDDERDRGGNGEGRVGNGR